VSGVAGMSLLSFYIIWSRFRIFCIRQDLFEVRDALWDKARELGCFDDPAYMIAREKLNSLIRTAHTISLPIMLYVTTLPSEEDENPIVSTNQEMQKAIDRAIEQAAFCLTRYVVYYRPFSGLLWLRTVLVFLYSAKGIVVLSESIARWFRGSGPGQLEALSCR
jgi:hypothetical protein